MIADQVDKEVKDKATKTDAPIFNLQTIQTAEQLQEFEEAKKVINEQKNAAKKAL